ncbi:cytidine monophosphate N-acetylneuraminic acid synthetase [Aureococcus anophagefferens]|nr:cytidine monophosphate N-acetylneuraminic acid synthetase [Aureococcus anophagefferens]
MAAHVDAKPHALILARGGSKGIPRKNIKPLNGVPLLVYNVKAALASGVFGRVVVSSDDDEILAVAARAGASTHARSAASAAAGCTSPLTGAEDFAAGHARFVAQGADSLVTVVRAHRFLWKQAADGSAAPCNYDPVKRPRRQDWDGELIENGAFYFFTVAALRASGSRLSGRVVAHEMPEETLAEIDTLADWQIVEGLAADKFKDAPKAWGF